MSNYRRNYVPGATYFFTLVTFRRKGFYPDSWGCEL
jgi:REP element-mobilizing transposase RayT